MTKIIPRYLIEHLECVSGQELPQQPEIIPASHHALTSQYSVEDILNGKTFFSEDKDDKGRDVGVVVALAQALEYAGAEGIVANLSEFIAAKVKAEKTHDFWKKWYTVHTEEDIGIDKKGLLYDRNTPVLVVVNGGGILTPERIRQAYAEGLLDHSAKYQENEFDNLLEGKLPSGITIPMYRLEEIKAGLSGLPHQFGVVMPYSIAQATKSGFHQKKPFLENPLVIARAAGCLDQLEAFYEKAKDSDGDLGNHHPFDGRDASVPQGRVLFGNDDHSGLSGISLLNNLGRFVGVAPEALGAKKEGVSQ